MAIAALNSAATGLQALSFRIDVVANNLANAETTAFKRSRTNFEDLIYITQRQPGARNAAGEVAPAGIQVGLGVRVSNTTIDLTQGSPESTGQDLDVAIEGPGFFRIQLPPSLGTGEGYTRSGQLFVNNQGELVLGSRDGYRLLPPVTLPANYEKVIIGEDGTISVMEPGSLEATIQGNLTITRFPNPQGLRNLGGSIYLETDASGPPNDVTGEELGSTRIMQGFLEASNVDPVKELVTLIKTQRSFELNSQSIQTADQALQTIANLRRF